jgi:hypothetical protein
MIKRYGETHLILTVNYKKRESMLEVLISSYSRRNSNVSEYNYDAMLNFNKDLTEKLNLEGNIGFNLRNNVSNTISAATNGGLNLRSLYLFRIVNLLMLHRI